MAKKKLLNEATVRRFMGLAGMESNLVSNKLNEMYSMSEEEEELDAEEAGGDEMDMDAEAADDGVINLDAEKVEKFKDAAEVIMDMASNLETDAPMDAEPMDAAPEEPAPELDADEEDPELDADADADDDDDEQDMLEGVELELSEDEVVQEVARRVAKRILKAKRAKAQLDEALGRKTRR